MEQCQDTRNIQYRYKRTKVNGEVLILCQLCQIRRDLFRSDRVSFVSYCRRQNKKVLMELIFRPATVLPIQCTKVSKFSADDSWYHFPLREAFCHGNPHSLLVVE